jgi:hypothetical protein
MKVPKPWHSIPPRGAATNHPAVLALAAGPDPGTKPMRHEAGGRVLVHYSRPRVHLDRGAWEQLPPDGVLVMRVRPANEVAYTLAMTRDELEAVFGPVRETTSWAEDRCYHFPKSPAAVHAFRVEVAPGPRTSIRPGPLVAATPPPSSQQPTPRALQVLGESPRTNAVEWARWWAHQLQLEAEPADYIAQVDAWRAAWRPARVRVLLVAESHVGPRPGDDRVRVEVPGASQGLPPGFCRLVYCLGYGENGLCVPSAEENASTWQYWDIFSALADGLDAKPVRKAGTTLDQRVRSKLDSLRRLQERGIWLVDASVMALYAPGGGRGVSGPNYLRLVRESFERWVWPSVAGDNPEQVWVIGRGVGRALAGLPRIEAERVVSQPQDRDQGRAREGMRAMVEGVVAV